jgi:hypothetical protein
MMRSTKRAFLTSLFPIDPVVSVRKMLAYDDVSMFDSSISLVNMEFTA